MLKKALIPLLLLVVLLLSGCLPEYYEEVRLFRQDYKPGMLLSIKNRVGDITLENWNQNYIMIEARIRGRASELFMAKQLVEATVIDLSRLDWRILLEAIRPETGFTSGVSVDYNIKVPHRVDLEIESSTGDIDIEGINGAVFVETNSGEIKIDNVYGDLCAETSTGDIEVDAVFGSIDLDSSTGDIYVDYIQGQANLYSSTGEIRAYLDLIPGSRNEIRTSTGDINLYLSDDISAEIRAITGSGSIGVFNLNLDSLKWNEKNLLFGIIGRGRAKLEVQSNSGDINLYGH